jgi:hypothetical protein
MARTSTARRLDEAPSAPVTRLEFGGGDPPVPPVQPNAPIASNAWLATVMFLGAEAMFFAGLIGAFIVFRIGSAVWPPPFQPRLPIGITGVNTIILLASAITMHMALRAVRNGTTDRLRRFEQYLRRTILYLDRLSRIPCGRRVGLVDCGVCAGHPWSLLEAKKHRFAGLRHVLDVCCCPVADSLRFGVSVLNDFVDSEKMIR